MPKQPSQPKLLTAMMAVALSVVLLIATPSAALADPDPVSPDSVNVDSLSGSDRAKIGQLEAELASLRAQQDENQLASEEAVESFNRARDELDVAQAEMQQAQKAESEANLERDKAQVELAKLIMSVYRDRSLSLAALTPYLEADGLYNMEIRQQAVSLFGEEADRKIQRYDAAEAVAKVIHGEAQKNVEKHQTALQKVEAEREVANRVAAESANRVVELERQRDQMIVRLAELRRVSIEQERARQEQLESQAEARAEAAAQVKAQKDAAQARAKAEREAQQRAAAEAARQEELARQSAGQNKPKPGGTNTGTSQADKDKAAADKAAREKAAREKAAADKAAREKAALEKAAREKAAREKAAREKAERDAAAAAANRPASSKALGAVAWARSRLGIPYVWGGASDSGYDCSGYVQAAWRTQGVRIPHSSRMQYNYGTKVPLDAAQPGDLLFWSRNGSPGGIHHVAMYIGNGQMMEAPRPGKTTQITKVRYRRIMPYAVRLG
ncbi:C40 family peptidase [Boudabousia marimammalium]|uniref:NlpC/P60 domain-containing protein n=1 Tax=Boudabousia marimammalium TaxID=156892 RepID=A0A1Q5PMA3_9ACTO|nr:C40 family peptidase [Boudabousia marimammalium]OKL48688.1 hypothetical protein BM477_05690 [Boudabousia marimammalium]